MLAEPMGSLSLDACRLDNRPPLADFGLVVGTEHLRHRQSDLGS
jgi:hypothetical protein